MSDPNYIFDDEQRIKTAWTYGFIWLGIAHVCLCKMTLQKHQQRKKNFYLLFVVVS